MKRIILFVVVLTVVAALPAVSQGARKSHVSSARAVPAKAHALAVNEVGHGLAVQQSASVPNGEPKNELPFTRRLSAKTRALSVNEVGHGLAVQQSASVPNGEPKNEPPFTRPVIGAASDTASSGNGFDWIEGVFLAIAALLVAGAAFGAARLLRRTAATPIA